MTIDSEELREHLSEAVRKLGSRSRILIVPPDFTRFHSRAGEISVKLHELWGDSVKDVLPALGTHVPMTDEQLEKMYPGIPRSLFRDHDWRNDVVTIGEVPAEFVSTATDGIYRKDWPAQLNRLVWEGGHDLIVSVGQVVPHEVIGMANHNKNLFVGTGGALGINESHFIGAVYGMERMMGRADTPLRRILNEAENRFCQHLPILYVLTVMGTDESGSLVQRGLFIGDDFDCFEQACELALKVNFTMVAKPLADVVVYLDEEEFHSTWLGNKAIYRTRMAIADEGLLTILAPGVKTFGEDSQIDQLIRKYGYRTTTEVLSFVDDNEDLRNNLSAAAHLIHGSTENRFTVHYCPGHLTEQEIRGVGYGYRSLTDAEAEFDVSKLKDGLNQLDSGREIFFIRNPAQGLWAAKERLVD